MPALALTTSMRAGCSVQPFTSHLRTRANVLSSNRVAIRAAATKYKVEIQHDGQTHVLDVPESATILSVALDTGLELPHDCKLGVCMTCPAKLLDGKLDQSGSMLSDDVAQQGYALLCVAQPRSDCKITTISEDELLDLQLGA